MSFARLEGHGAAVVEVTIDGEGPFRMLLDTGTTACLLSEAALARFDGQKPALEPLPGDGLRVGKVKVTKLFRPRSFIIGGMDLTQMGLLIVPRKGLEQLGPLLDGVDGILGMNLLEHFAVELSFDSDTRGTLSFYAGGKLADADVETLGFRGAQHAALRRVEGDEFRVAAVLRVSTDSAHGEGARAEGDGSAAVPMLLDTGAFFTALPSSLVPQGARRGIRTNRSRSVLGGEDPKEVRLTEVRFESVSLGGAHFSDAALWEAPGLTVVKRQQIGQIGLDLLARCRLLIDFPAGRLYAVRRDAGTGGPTRTGEKPTAPTASAASPP